MQRWRYEVVRGVAHIYTSSSIHVIAMFMCDRYQMDAYKARGILPHCSVLCDDDCTNHSHTGGYCEHLYLLIQNQSDLVYKSLGIPTLEDPRVILGAQIENVAKRVNKVGIDDIMHCAIEISRILSGVSEKADLNVPEDTITSLAHAVSLGLFLDDPRDAIDEKMLGVLLTLKKLISKHSEMHTAPDLEDDFE